MPDPGTRPSDQARNRDEDLKPGRPPRPATEPPGAEGSSATSKTQTDPATGEPHKKPPPPS
ncbi:MAG TPA: hypothetical protein VIP08_12935 [Phenylobacterium sp.]|uniref:hypothetical protein n=1 Tax=Phenylobacterium sp. TaxID=1871053 RepID=UPI002F94FA9C